jgi:hypothetical protein
MAIEFDCPHCTEHYRVKDDLAGKRATCKNPDCRKVIVVPASANGTPAAPELPAAPADVEAAAVAALADAPAEAQAAAAKDVPLQCPVCEHKWAEPATKAGKNVLCPECRHRIKVPEVKQEVPDDWRRQNTKLPSLAKQNVEKLEGVQASEAQMVSGGALKQAGAADDEVEPRPLKQKVVFGLIALGVLAGGTAGVMYLMKSRTEGKKDQLMEQALAEYKGADESIRPPGPQDSLYAAMLSTAAGEYAARQNDKVKLAKAVDEFHAAVTQVRESAQKDPKGGPSAAAERNAVAAELALAVLVLGGTDEQVKKEVRHNWVPPDIGNRQLRVNEKTLSVHGELAQVLGLVKGADPDFKAALARRLTRELVKRGKADLAGDLPALLFTDPEQPEAKGLVALELMKLTNKDDPLVKSMADELKEGPAPPSVVMLHKAIDGTPAPSDLTDQAVLAAAGLAALKGDPKAVGLAQRTTRPEGKLRALLQVAEWAADPTEALNAAAAIAAAKPSAGGQSATLPASVLLRLSQVAAAAGKADQAKVFAEAIPDEGLKAWAKADALRLRLAGSQEPADEALAEVPDDAKKLKAGHAWGRLWVARHNAKLGGGRDPKAVANWPAGSIKPFGLAGIALGLQDRE